MDEVLPEFFSCGWLRTDFRAEPLPSSNIPFIITPIVVDFPASTFTNNTYSYLIAHFK